MIDQALIQLLFAIALVLEAFALTIFWFVIFPNLQKRVELLETRVNQLHEIIVGKR